MAIITKYWKKLLYFLITGSTSVFIAACYGIAMKYDILGSWTIKTKDNKNQPIEGLEVTIENFEDGSVYPSYTEKLLTDSTGTVEFLLQTYNLNATHVHKAYIKDIDGEAHGGVFKATEIVKDDHDTISVQMDLNQ